MQAYTGFTKDESRYSENPVIKALWNGESAQYDRFKTMEFVGIQALGKARVVVGRAVSTDSTDELDFTLVAFPELEHVKKYIKSGAFSHSNGPADKYIGSIGVLSYKREHDVVADTTAYNITMFQSSINFVNLAQALKYLPPEDYLSNELSSHYYIWKKALLISFANIIEIETKTLPPVHQKVVLRNQSRLPLRDFERIKINALF